MAGGDGPKAFSNEESSSDMLALPFRTDAGIKGKDVDCSFSIASKESCTDDTPESDGS